MRKLRSYALTFICPVCGSVSKYGIGDYIDRQGNVVAEYREGDCEVEPNALLTELEHKIPLAIASTRNSDASMSDLFERYSSFGNDLDASVLKGACICSHCSSSLDPVLLESYGLLTVKHDYKMVSSAYVRSLLVGYVRAASYASAPLANAINFAPFSKDDYASSRLSRIRDGIDSSSIPEELPSDLLANMRAEVDGVVDSAHADYSLAGGFDKAAYSSGEVLLKYMKDVFAAESAVERLKAVGLSLRIDRYRARCCMGLQKSILANADTPDFARMREDKKHLEAKKAAALDGSMPNSLLGVDVDAPVCPESPKEPDPVMPCEAPQEPKYEKPGLFNKRAVEAKNNSMEMAYRTALKEYDAYQRYRKDLTEYEEGLAEYKELKRKYDDDLAEYDGIVSAARVEYVAEVDSALGELREKLEGAMAATGKLPQPSLIALLDVEIATLDDQLREAVESLEKLYAVDIVYGKYRTLPAVSTMLEYLESGRCCELSGKDGAYNLYESELRANVVIAELEVIRRDVEAVKAEQYLLYKQLSEINSCLKGIAQDSRDLSEELRETRTAIVAGNAILEDISQSAAASAHYAKVTAYWAKESVSIQSSPVFGFIV